ncbi:MAG: DUF1365 domain-containing protein [Actinomycetota bacterium]|nr:DUF1365 domain-containing protein [Actinomycetota bacterium]
MSSGSESALYEGWVRHRRLDPVEHEFRYPMFMTYLDLAELPWVLDGLAGWSARRPALARFRRQDFLGDVDRPLDDCVREAVEERSGARPSGPIRLLTNLRHFGHSFNPVSFYYCFDESREQVESVLAEVTNTPWGERHAYVLGRGDGAERVIRGQISKAFHVSPLQGMDQTYDWRTTEPGENVLVHIDSQRDGRTSFDATLSLKRVELTTQSARRIHWRYPAISAQVVAKIYWQAARLKLKGVPYHRHPESG